MRILDLAYILLIMGILGFILVSQVHAGEKHHKPITTNTTNTTVNQYSGASGAMAMDAITFSPASKGVQIGIGAAYNEYGNGRSEQGVAFGIGGNVCANTVCGVINGKINYTDRGGQGIAIGSTWSF
ncbi:hypothetical protein MNBD_ALPHA03-1283 [hydrothermal vent metagenome]|uniref:Trimeric autotransporter adhesin YadA-like C-terminal membrane anchor domain-containing protein n=1 Tax=hydrothermal vent metagenome TaxID=652676 RepID=A0A3B1BTH3_9ZZZZ